MTGSNHGGRGGAVVAPTQGDGVAEGGGTSVGWGCWGVGVGLPQAPQKAAETGCPH